MHYNISYNTVSRVLLGILGMGPRSSGVVVDATSIRARLGWSGNVTIPRSTIASVEQVDRIPWWLGFGIHGGTGGTWSLNGAGTGAVRIDLDKPANGNLLGMSLRPRTIYLSLENPEGFVSEVRSSLPT